MPSLLKNLLKLVAGSFAGQIVTIGTMPLVTRLYSPDDFGVFAILASIWMVTGPISTFRFNSTILLPKSSDQSLNLLTLSFLSSTFFSLLILCLVALYALNITPWRLPSIEGVASYLWILPLGITLHGLNLSTQAWALRQEQFRDLALANFLRPFCNRAFVLTAGFCCALNASGLIIGNLIGSISSLFYLLISCFKRRPVRILDTISLKKMLILARRYKAFPIFGTLSTVVETVSAEMPVLILAGLFTPAIAGSYALGVRMIRMPMVMFGNSLQKAFLQRAALLKDKQAELARETQQMLTYIIYFTLPLILILMLLGDRIFSVIFGIEWLEAGKYVQILAPSFLFLFILRPLKVVFIVYERQRQRLISDIILFISRGGILLLVGILTNSTKISLLAMSIVTCIVIFGILIYISSLIATKSSDLFKFYAGRLIILGPLILGLLIVKFVVFMNLTASAAVMILAIVIQGLTILYFEPPMRKIAKKYIPFY